MKRLFLPGVLLLVGCTSVQTRIEINAPARAVREALFKFDDYPRWNPFIVKVDGVVEPGKVVAVTVRPVGKDEISGPTTIVALSENRLEWRGSLAVPGLFRGDHEFIIEPLAGDRTLFCQNEKMAGLIIPFFDFKPERAGFVEMNEALKRKAESASK
jgi:hypothetical protein